MAMLSLYNAITIGYNYSVGKQKCWTCWTLEKSKSIVVTVAGRGFN